MMVSVSKRGLLDLDPCQPKIRLWMLNECELEKLEWEELGCLELKRLTLGRLLWEELIWMEHNRLLWEKQLLYRARAISPKEIFLGTIIPLDCRAIFLDKISRYKHQGKPQMVVRVLVLWQAFSLLLGIFTSRLLRKILQIFRAS